MKSKREQLSNNAANIIETLLVKGTGAFPGVKPPVPEIVDRVNALTYYRWQLQAPHDFFDPRLPIEALDQAAREFTRKSQIVAVTAGVSTGMLGMPGLAIDLPVLVANTVGLVRRHAVTYGFMTIEDSTDDPVPLLLALGASVGADMIIDRVGTKFGEKVGLEVGTKLVEKYLVKRVSEQFAARIVSSWLPRLVPIIGTATIATLDTLFLTAAGRQSMQYFRTRHLQLRQYIATQAVDRSQWKPLAMHQSSGALSQPTTLSLASPPEPPNKTGQS
jgi:uncharacterized protein (DUF697 family)